MWLWLYVMSCLALTGSRPTCCERLLFAKLFQSQMGTLSVSSLVCWFRNPLAAGSGLGERRGQNALFFLWQLFSQPKMAQDWKIGHFRNPLCVNFQKMVSEVKKNYSPGPLTLKQCSLQSGEVLPPIWGGLKSRFLTSISLGFVPLHFSRPSRQGPHLTSSSKWVGEPD